MGTRVSSGLPGIVLALALVGQACTPEAPPKQEVPKPVQAQLPPAPPFDADSAYAFVRWQVDFGPRVPGTAAHAACGDWIVARLKAAGATVTEQRGTVTAFNGNPLPLRNIIGSWRPGARDRILLLAHYDTRPFAERWASRPGALSASRRRAKAPAKVTSARVAAKDIWAPGSSASSGRRDRRTIADAKRKLAPPR